MFKVQNTNYFQIPFLTRPFAIAKIAGGEENKEIHGYVKFFSCKDGVLVLSEIHNLPKTETNFFAMHIHENGECDGDFSYQSRCKQGKGGARGGSYDLIIHYFLMFSKASRILARSLSSAGFSAA